MAHMEMQCVDRAVLLMGMKPRAFAKHVFTQALNLDNRNPKP